MRISDWSSDVCSSDLDRMLQQGLFAFDRRQRNPDLPGGGRLSATVHVNLGMPAHDQRTGKGVSLPVTTGNGHIGTLRRSEEHTSELQSLMRISYAVFCLKKKKHNTPQTHTDNILNN